MEKKYILVIDSGSTGIRAILFNKKADIVEKEYKNTPAEYPEPGAIEHDPIMMWDSLIFVVKEVIKKANISVNEIDSVGITNQRGSFCLWEKDTGKPITNFINWADVRAGDTAIEMNQNFKWKLLKGVAAIASGLTGNPMLTTTKMLTFTTDHASSRLKWLLDSNPGMREKCKSGNIMFGTIDTWYIYKLTGGKIHATDYSNAVSTGLFNPFEMKWNDIVLNIFDIPLEILPEVKETNGDFGKISAELFGEELSIHSAVGDQQSALFGQCCFKPGEVKISQGSGAFVDCNVGEKPKISKRGLFPLLAWKLIGDEKPIYMLEGFVATAGTLIDWLGNGLGLSDSPKVLNEFAAQCKDTEGVIFIPTPTGIRFPYFNPRTKGSILGLSLRTHRRHVARAVLEGIAMRLIDIIEGIEKDTKVKIKAIKVDGGVSKSDILLQILANFANLNVERAPEPDMTAVGAAYLAGLGTGFWKSQDEILKLSKNYTVFEPVIDEDFRKEKRNKWKKAIKALLKIE